MRHVEQKIISYDHATLNTTACTLLLLLEKTYRELLHVISYRSHHSVNTQLEQEIRKAIAEGSSAPRALEHVHAFPRRGLAKAIQIQNEIKTLLSGNGMILLSGITLPGLLWLEQIYGREQIKVIGTCTYSLGFFRSDAAFKEYLFQGYKMKTSHSDYLASITVRLEQ